MLGDGVEEAVEVNQRALIDKVLARYSGEFTVFRELLQNSDDAQSKAVEIHFLTNGPETPDERVLTAEPLSNLRATKVNHWTFKNNGMIFRDQDWDRLRKIAEGNPDEEKIGAFGVGFYSLFSMTDNPSVTSGSLRRRFFWKDNKDQLAIKVYQVPSEHQNQWTAFEMPLRVSDTIPNIFDFTRFLASSITFMEHLSEVSVFLDDKRLSLLRKTAGSLKELPMPRDLVPTSQKKLMTVQLLRSSALTIEAEVMRCVYSAGTEKPKVPPRKPQLPPSAEPVASTGFWASLFGRSTAQRAPTPQPERIEPVVPEEPIDYSQIHKTSVTLSIRSAVAGVQLDKQLEVDLERTTKKKPPRVLTYKLIYTGKSEYDASVEEDEKHTFAKGSIFQGLRADLDGAGTARIFIGHSTAQTTGLGGHMAARFIPTVERENIDLVDRSVSVWNKELLFVGGFLARATYDEEMSKIDTMWKGLPKSDSTNAEFTQRLNRLAMHVMKFFTFYTSTPSAEISGLLEAAFFGCSRIRKPMPAFPILTTAGIRDVDIARKPDSTILGFLPDLPVLPSEIANEANGIVSAYGRVNKMSIRDIQWSDVIKGLQDSSLNQEQLVKCLKWFIAINRSAQSGVDMDTARRTLLETLIMTTPDGGVMVFRDINMFINPSRLGQLPEGAPLPPSVLPLDISKQLDTSSLSSAFAWRELTIVDWVNHICNPKVVAGKPEYDIQVSAAWAERILALVSRLWSTLSADQRQEIVKTLKSRTCIPTSQGMRLPEESYFQNVKVLKDLPVVTLPSGGSLNKMNVVLEVLGVRKHVDLNTVLVRMFKSGDWSVEDLVKYLVSVKDHLTADEKSKLRETPLFQKRGTSSSETITKPERQVYKIKDLYEPDHTGVFAKLGLSELAWNKTWRSNSPEATFLFSLGLQRWPSLETVIKLAGDPDDTVRPVALRYFFDKFDKYSTFDPQEFKNVKFVPALRGHERCLGSPDEVYSNASWAGLGFMVPDPSIGWSDLVKLRLQEKPHPSVLVAFLAKNQPKDVSQAREWFGVLASGVSGFSSKQRSEIAQFKIVPISSADGKLRYLAPQECYIAGSGNTFHSNFFTFVDFGTNANTFLRSCGSRDQPSVEEVVKILIRDPNGFYETAGGREGFLNELRNIIASRRLISDTVFKLLSRSPVLLCNKRVISALKANASMYSRDDLEDEEYVLQPDLRAAKDILIVDDNDLYNYFGSDIYVAPQDDYIEDFYADLGSKRLSSVVQEDIKKSSEIKNSKQAFDIRNLVLERLPLFLHEQTHTKPLVSYRWLTEPGNFVVTTYGKLTIVKTLHHGAVRIPREIDAFATARRVGHGPIQLWLAGNAQADMFEIAASLCRFILQHPKANDSLLLATILSTDLRALKRRGYNVNRILKKQDADREAQTLALKKREEDAAIQAEKALMEKNARRHSDIDKHSSSASSGAPTLDNMGWQDMPSVPGSYQGQPGRKSPSPPPESKRNTLLGPSLFSNHLRNFKEKISNAIEGRSATPSPGSAKQNIRHNIDQAISACKRENSSLIRNPERMETVKEAINDGYCDITSAIDLSLAGELNGHKVYFSKDLQEGPQIINTKRDEILRFIQVAQRLTAVFTLPPTSVNIFSDVQGPMMAFNRGGSLFLNLRYYVSWHDSQVLNGEPSSAYISWYFTLAHELAHNLIGPHNSEHEFYMSEICQQFMPSLVRLLSTS